MWKRMLLLAVPVSGLAFTAGCHNDHDDWDHDHRRVERREDVIIVPARGERWDHDRHWDRDGWRHD